MFAALPQPHQVLSTMPRISPIAHPVRQWRVAVIAIRQLSVIVSNVPPGGIMVQPTSHTAAAPPGPNRRFNGAGELPAPPRADHPGRPDAAQPSGHGLDAHRARGPGP